MKVKPSYWVLDRFICRKQRNFSTISTTQALPIPLIHQTQKPDQNKSKQSQNTDQRVLNRPGFNTKHATADRYAETTPKEFSTTEKSQPCYFYALALAYFQLHFFIPIRCFSIPMCLHVR
jgi:hypothetical protein